MTGNEFETPGTRVRVWPAESNAGRNNQNRHGSEAAMEHGSNNNNNNKTAFVWGDMPEEQFYQSKGVRASQSYFKTPRGLSLFTRSWEPLQNPSPRGLILMIHGYGNDISWTFQNTAIRFAQAGFAALAADLEGHGLSDGLKAYVPDVFALVQDLSSFFSDYLAQNPRFQNVPRFLHGESMGGAICLLMHFADPGGWDGAVLVSPMCRISENARPRWPVPQILRFVSIFAPTLPVVPAQDLIEKSVKDPWKRALARSNPRRYAGKPRLGTVLELLRVTDYLGGRLQDVDLPFLVVHGDADVVTDPSVSRNLYEVAKSKDKAIRIYQGMSHSLLFGEPDENVAIVFKDISDWLTQRLAVKPTRR